MSPNSQTNAQIANFIERHLDPGHSSDESIELHTDDWMTVIAALRAQPDGPHSGWVDADADKPDHGRDVLVWHCLGDRSGCDHAYDVAAWIGGKWIFPWDRDSRNNPPHWVRKWREIEPASPVATDSAEAGK